MRPIAIIGAAGFVGSRLIETCMLSGIKDILPIIRNNYNLGRLCRYGLHDRIRIADAVNEKQLIEAINGTPTVVNLAAADPVGIIESAEVVLNACIKSGVKRLIHLSSAVVYGQVESSCIHDDSPLERNHWMPYARAKIVAEGIMRRVSGSPSFEVVVLRPGIVWGPRSRWSFNAALELKENRAFIVGDGSGICNSIYIDNLVASILVCCSQASEVAGFYNVADDEVVTWHDFYASLSEFLHCDMASIPRVNSDSFKPNLETILQDIKASDLYSNLKKSIPLEKREIIKQWLAAYQRKQKTPQTDKNKHQSKVFISREMWHLQTTKHKLPTKKIAEKFNFTPPVSFQDGMQMTINWLRFVGF